MQRIKRTSGNGWESSCWHECSCEYLVTVTFQDDVAFPWTVMQIKKGGHPNVCKCKGSHLPMGWINGLYSQVHQQVSPTPLHRIQPALPARLLARLCEFCMPCATLLKRDSRFLVCRNVDLSDFKLISVRFVKCKISLFCLELPLLRVSGGSENREVSPIQNLPK